MYYMLVRLSVCLNHIKGTIIVIIIITKINVWHQELKPDTVAHLSTNQAQCRLTLLIEANALTTMPDHL